MLFAALPLAHGGFSNIEVACKDSLARTLSLSQAQISKRA